MTQRRLAHGAILLLAQLGAANAATPVDRQVPADPAGTLEVHNIVGSVEVIGGNRRDVHVTGTLADNVERLDVSTDGARVIVRVVMREDSRSWDNGTRLTVEAPAAMELDIRTVSASIDVRGSEGEQRLRSVSGNVVTNGFTSELDASSVSGNVTVRGGGVAGDARTVVKSVSGRVTVDGIAGEVQAESVSGRVDITASSLRRAQVSSISGDVSVRSGLASDSRIEAETTSGDVTFVIAGDAAAEYELSSFSGNIRNCFGPPAPAASSFGPPSREHRFREGSSNARVRANTMSGTIELCQ